MKRTILYAMFVCLFVSPVLATYTYTITSGYDSGLTLNDSETLLMTGGGIGHLTLNDSSEAIIEGTSTLQQFFGGIWEIELGGTSHVEISGGEIAELDLNNQSTAILSGGYIYSLSCSQVILEDPHITLYYSGDLPTIETVEGYDYLTGSWGDGTSFEILLLDTGYNVLGNFEFIYIPEPATMALFAIGGLMLRKKRI